MPSILPLCSLSPNESPPEVVPDEAEVVTSAPEVVTNRAEVVAEHGKVVTKYDRSGDHPLGLAVTSSPAVTGFPAIDKGGDGVTAVTAVFWWPQRRSGKYVAANFL